MAWPYWMTFHAYPNQVALRPYIWFFHDEQWASALLPNASLSGIQRRAGSQRSIMRIRGQNKLKGYKHENVCKQQDSTKWRNEGVRMHPLPPVSLGTYPLKTQMLRKPHKQSYLSERSDAGSVLLVCTAVLEGETCWKSSRSV